VRIFSQTLNLLTAAKVVNRHTAYMDSFDALPFKPFWRPSFRRERSSQNV
jgi:hypothetical protein